MKNFRYQSLVRKIISIVLFVCVVTSLFAGIKDPDPKRFEKNIHNFIKWDRKNSFCEKSVLFVGSSSIVGWSSAEYFPKQNVINRGFGGSHISDVLFYYDDVVKKYNPTKIVFYCGDNDIAGKKSVEQVLEDFETFIEKVNKDFPKTEIYYIPIKPSLSRWKMWKEMDETNLKIKSLCDSDKKMFYVDIATPMLMKNDMPDSTLFRDDGLHLNKKGYDLWSKVLSKVLKK